jgi:hypothetical protein
MGRDNAPWSRQARHLQRKQGQRASHDRLLIVSEGSRTEPNYFTEIRTAYRLHTANVKVLHSRLGTSPLQVVRYAEQLFLEGDPHTRLVPRAFDRDEHESYANALRIAASLDGKLRNDNKQPVRFSAVASIPCFELWLLLHFEHIQSPIDRHEALRRLKRHIPRYEKGCRETFRMTRNNLETALSRAELLDRRNSAHSAPEPYTGSRKPGGTTYQPETIISSCSFE